jgi:hypothetical protein
MLGSQGRPFPFSDPVALIPVNASEMILNVYQKIDKMWIDQENGLNILSA